MDSSNNGFEFSKENFIELIETGFRKVLSNFFEPDIIAHFTAKAHAEKMSNAKKEYLDLNEIADLLHVSRQSVSKWFKSEGKDKLFRPFSFSVGKHSFYDPIGIVAVIVMNSDFFNDNTTMYCEAILKSLKEKYNEIDYKYSTIKAKVISSIFLNDSDSLFYTNECASRGELNYLMPENRK